MSDPPTLLAHPCTLSLPHRLTERSSWQEHIPFGMALVAAIQPRVLVELGTQGGDSYCAFCQTVDALALPTCCFAVDTWKGDVHAGRYGEEIFADLREYHDVRYGRFSRMIRSTFDEARDHFPDASIDLLHIDGLHTEEAVAHDFEHWRPKLSDRAVVLFHDTNARILDFGVWRFWKGVSTRYPSFEFVHGYGLGVLAVGPMAPAELLALCRLEEVDRASVRDRFSALGSRVWLKGQLDIAQQRRALAEALASAAEKEAAHRAARIHQLEQQVARLPGLELQARDATALTRTRAELDRRLAEAQATIRALRERNDASEGALSALSVRLELLETTIAEGQVGIVERFFGWLRKNNHIRLARRRALRSGGGPASAPGAGPPVATVIRGQGPIAWLRRKNRARLARRKGSPAGTAPARTLPVAPRSPQAAAPPVRSDRLIFDHQRIRIVTTRHTEYVARLLELHLLRLGFSPSIEFECIPDEDAGFIVICPQMFGNLPSRYIAFQMEQSVNPRWFTGEYLDILRQAEAVFDYAEENIEYLLRQGLPMASLFWMPITPHLALRTPLPAPASSDLPFDFAFYGDPSSPRRQALLKRLSERFRVLVLSEVFGDELQRKLRLAKAVINLHFYEDALLETTRLSEAVSNGFVVLSEGVRSKSTEALFAADVTYFECGDAEDMLVKARDVLQRADGGRTAKPGHVVADIELGRYLERYMIFRGHLPTTHLSPSFYPRDARSEEFPRLCLSLPETPSRRKIFMERNHHGFDLFDGARLSPGWMGCALSYRTLARQALSSPASYLVVCEDDVIFGEDFARRFGNIERWLREHDGQWDIFSGLIADLHAGAEVSAVAEVNGELLVTINRMTSTVFNAYSRQALRLLSTWDEELRDATSNTIDRYLERKDDLRVVVTLPFLVGHCEDQHSTIWGFQNDTYNEMIRRSEQALRLKTDAFLAGVSPDVPVTGDQSAPSTERSSSRGERRQAVNHERE
jgi:hypothetical protein